MFFRTIILLLLSISVASCKFDFGPPEGTKKALQWGGMKKTKIHYADEAGRMGPPIGFTKIDDTFILDYKLKLNDELVGVNSKDMIGWKKIVEAKSPQKNYTNISAFIYPKDSIESKKEFIYVNDAGQVFTTMKDKPILESEFLKKVTGTKLFYDNGLKKWILLFSLSNQVLFYNSTDFKDWQYVSNFGTKDGYHGQAPWRSPDLFQVNVAGNVLQKKWVLLISTEDGHPTKLGGTQYFVGDFDGKRFSNNNDFSKVLWLDWGADNFGGLTVQNSSTEAPNFIGWMDAHKYSDKDSRTKEKASMTIPRKLELKDTYFGMKLFANPIKSFEQKRGTKISQRSIKLSDKENAVSTTFSTPAEFIFEFSQKSNEGYTVEFSNSKGALVDFGYNGIRKMYLLNRDQAGQDLFPQLTKQKEHFAPRFSTLSKMNVRIIVGECSVEIFADDGLTVFSEFVFPTTSFSQMKLWGTTGQIMMDKMEIYQLN